MKHERATGRILRTSEQARITPDPHFDDDDEEEAKLNPNFSAVRRKDILLGGGCVYVYARFRVQYI